MPGQMELRKLFGSGSTARYKGDAHEHLAAKESLARNSESSSIQACTSRQDEE